MKFPRVRLSRRAGIKVLTREQTGKFNWEHNIMADRYAKTERKTKETDILVEMNLDGRGKYDIDTGVAFLDHMLTHVGKHGKIDLTIKARGDLDVDAHHTVEDVGICIGSCLCEALGDKKGISRFGSITLPMEDAKAEVAVDLSGRAFCVYDVKYHTEKIGDFDVECIEEFLRSLANAGKLTPHSRGDFQGPGPVVGFGG